MRMRMMVGPNNDYSFGHGQNDFFIDCPQAVGLLIATRMRMNQGECFVDVTDGLAVTDILGTNTQGTRDLAHQDRILETPGVSANGITAYTSSEDPDTREFTVDATVDTIYSADDGTGNVTTTTTVSESF